MSEKVLLHKGFNAQGEKNDDCGFNDQSEIDFQAIFTDQEQEQTEAEISDEESDEKSFVTDCTILWATGQYQKPNVVISDRKFRFVSKSRNVTRIQLRSVNGGGIRYYSGLGTFRIPNGEYVLSLWGSTYPHRFIKACIRYNE